GQPPPGRRGRGGLDCRRPPARELPGRRRPGGRGMSEDWTAGGGDPFVDPADPDAVAREERRREREARRTAREQKQKTDAPPHPPRKEDPPSPPSPPRPPEDDFWDEDPEPFAEGEDYDEDGGEPDEPDVRRPRSPRTGSGVLGSLRRHPFRVVAAILAILVA